MLGVYMARSLSYDDGTPNGRVEYTRLEHNLTPEQREIYDTCAEAWHVVLNNIDNALKITEGERDARNAAMSAFWGAELRFFNQIVTSLQMPSVLKSVKADLKAGRQAVLQLTSTNEASALLRRQRLPKRLKTSTSRRATRSFSWSRTAFQLSSTKPTSTQMGMKASVLYLTARGTLFRTKKLSICVIN